MRHLGDITQISGNTAPTVDCIIGGSPCQDLSVAGKREGLAGARSGLFMEQIRIVKEMRARERRNGKTDVDIRPRYMVWENVPGAFSSNKGEDFRVVLEETARVADANAVIPRPEGGKWTTSGCIVADGWSIAWRVLDAQFWGVPQRRRRITLVADFGGLTAPEILFVRKSVSGDIEKSGAAGKAFAGDAEGGASYAVRIRGGCDGGGKGALVQVEKSGTLGAACNDQTIFCLQGNGIDRADTAGCNGKGWTEDVCYTLNTIARPAVFDARGNGDGETAPTMTGDHQNRITDYSAVVVELDRAALNQGANARFDMGISEDGKTHTLTERPPAVCYAIGNGQTNGTGLHSKVESLNCMHDAQAVIVAVDAKNGTESETNGTLQSNAFHSLNCNNTVRVRHIVRRLTPLECERLQGYPDGWTDIGAWTDSKGKVHQESTDSARYKALGNSIALPPWKWVLKRLCACYERDATMASLFDGIGGFPLLWEQLNGKGSCLWASEIEEFPIAVTKERIGD